MYNFGQFFMHGLDIKILSCQNNFVSLQTEKHEKNVMF